MAARKLKCEKCGKRFVGSVGLRTHLGKSACGDRHSDTTEPVTLTKRCAYKRPKAEPNTLRKDMMLLSMEMLRRLAMEE